MWKAILVWVVRLDLTVTDRLADRWSDVFAESVYRPGFRTKLKRHKTTPWTPEVSHEKHESGGTVAR